LANSLDKSRVKFGIPDAGRSIDGDAVCAQPKQDERCGEIGAWSDLAHSFAAEVIVDAEVIEPNLYVGNAAGAGLGVLKEIRRCRVEPDGINAAVGIGIAFIGWREV
jgi:hypothetical protein